MTNNIKPAQTSIIVLFTFLHISTSLASNHPLQSNNFVLSHNTSIFPEPDKNGNCIMKIGGLSFNHSISMHADLNDIVEFKTPTTTANMETTKKHYRPTIHFSIHGVPKDRVLNNFILNNLKTIYISHLNKYRFILPFDENLNLIGGYIKDLYVLGEYTVPKTAIIFVPNEELDDIKSKTPDYPHIYGYNWDKYNHIENPKSINKKLNELNIPKAILSEETLILEEAFKNIDPRLCNCDEIDNKHKVYELEHKKIAEIVVTREICFNEGKYLQVKVHNGEPRNVAAILNTINDKPTYYILKNSNGDFFDYMAEIKKTCAGGHFKYGSHSLDLRPLERSISEDNQQFENELKKLTERVNSDPRTALKKELKKFIKTLVSKKMKIEDSDQTDKITDKYISHNGTIKLADIVEQSNQIQAEHENNDLNNNDPKTSSENQMDKSQEETENKNQEDSQEEEKTYEEKRLDTVNHNIKVFIDFWKKRIDKEEQIEIITRYANSTLKETLIDFYG